MTVQQSQHHKCQILHHVGEIGMGILVQHFLPHSFPFQSMPVTIKDKFNGLFQLTVYRNKCYSLFQQCWNIVFKESLRFCRSQKLLCPNRVICMIQSAVQIGIFCCQLGITCRDNAPNLRANGATHPLFEERIVDNSAVGRLHTTHIVFQEVAVLGKRIPAFLDPCIGKVA